MADPVVVEVLADLCKLLVLLLLPNGRFSGFLYCTGFVGYLKAQRCPNNGHYGCRKVGFLETLQNATFWLPKQSFFFSKMIRI